MSGTSKTTLHVALFCILLFSATPPAFGVLDTFRWTGGGNSNSASDINNWVNVQADDPERPRIRPEAVEDTVIFPFSTTVGSLRTANLTVEAGVVIGLDSETGNVIEVRGDQLGTISNAGTIQLLDFGPDIGGGLLRGTDQNGFRGSPVVLTGGGIVRLAGGGLFGTFTNVDNTIVVNGEGSQILSMANQHVIRVDSGSLTGFPQRGGAIDNTNGMIHVSSGALMFSHGVDGGTLTAPAGSTLAALSLNSISFIGDAELVLTPNPIPVFAPGDTVTLTESSVDGSLTVTSGITLRLGGDISNFGTIYLEGDSTLSAGDVTTLDGGGEIVLDEATLTSGSNIDNIDNTIRGSGFVELPISNGGLIRAEEGTLELNNRFSFLEIDNESGRIEVAGDAHLALTGAGAVNGGVLFCESGSTVGSFDFSALDFSGTVQGDTTVRDGQFTLLDATHEGTLTTGDTGTLRLEGRIQNEGTIRVQPNNNLYAISLALNGAVVLVGNGELIVEAGVDNSNYAGNRITNVDHTIRGAGVLGYEIVNRGTLFADAQGSLTLTGLLARDEGVVKVLLDGPGFSQSGSIGMLFNDTVRLDGPLQPVVGDSLSAEVGDRYRFLTAGSISGTEFSSLDLSQARGYEFNVIYGSDFVELEVATVGTAGLLGDINCDGSTDFLDIGPFIMILSSGDAGPDQDKADINQDGVVDFLDIGPFITILSGGAK